MKVLFLRVLGMSLTASFLIAALILFRAMLKKTPKALVCGLWVLAAIRLICPFSIQSSFSILPTAVEEVSEDEWIEDHADSSDGIAALQTGTLLTGEIMNHETSPMELSSSEVNWQTIMRTVILTRLWVPILTGIWIMGVILMLLAAVRSFLRIRKKVAVSIQIEDNIWICDYIKTPFVLGMIHPRIYLPSDMSAAHFRSVTAHELAHLKRGDHWWKPIAYLILSIHWFNPLVWVSYILFCRDIELACDEKVVRTMNVSERKAYSEALLSLSLSHRLVSAAYPLSFGEVGVKERIKTVLNHKKPALWAAALALAGSTVLAACLMTNPTPEQVETGLNDMIAVANQVQSNEAEDHAVEELLQENGWIHLLLLGLDGDADGYENKRSDAVFVLSINRDEEKVILSSVPRDTIVYMSLEKDAYDKLSHGYAYGGAETMAEIFRKNFDIEISGYVTVNFQAMEEVVDLLGGLALTLTEQEAEHMGEYYGAWGLGSGTQLLSGYEVLQYCRIRKIDSDYVRNDRQFTVLQAIYEEVKNMPVTQYGDLVEAIYPYVSTSLSNAQCIALAGTILDLLDGQELVNDKLVDAKNSHSARVMGVSYVVVDDLVDTAVRWHENVLGISDYTPSDHLIEISEYISAIEN